MAFASATAMAASSCDPPLCTLSLMTMEDDFVPLIVAAMAPAMGAAVESGCSDETGLLDLSVVEGEFVAQSVEALAAVLLEVRAAALGCTPRHRRPCSGARSLHPPAPGHHIYQDVPGLGVMTHAHLQSETSDEPATVSFSVFTTPLANSS